MIGHRYDTVLRKLPMLAAFDCRGREAGLADGLGRAGIAMPASRNRLETGAAGIEVIRLGPSRVMVLASAESEGALNARLTDAFTTVDTADFALVSDMFVTFELSGRGGEDVLRQGAPLDLSPVAFPPGTATGTELWTVGIILIRPPDRPETFRMIVDYSYAGYIEDWLTVAAGGEPVLRPGVMIAPPPSLRP
jgi:heterotetrameric sarcosine oxidase gamma subunit